MKKLLFGLLLVNVIGQSVQAYDDVGVIGPSGEVLLYYREGGNIIVKNCDPNTILGSTPVNARTNCQGKVNKVPVESFKHVIRNLVSIEHLNVLKPLTPEEIRAYATGGPATEQVEEMMAELDRINAFIEAYGAENANLVRKEELLKALHSAQTLSSALRKITSEVERAVNLITDETKLTLIKFNSNKDQFLYTVLKEFDPNQKYPCGLTGPVDERIKDCSYQLTSKHYGFELVSRTKEFKEVYKDTNTGLLWSDRLPSGMSYDDAVSACYGKRPENGRIGTVGWRLPSREDFAQAHTSGVSSLPNMDSWFWTSTWDTIDRRKAYVTHRGITHNSYFYDYAMRNGDQGKFSVRCVGR